MLILGDLACPTEKHVMQLKLDMHKTNLFKNKLILCNLEGMISNENPYKEEKLFNHSHVLDAFYGNNVVFSLANNHTYDYPNLIETTQKTIEEYSFYSNGVMEANKVVPTEIKVKDNIYTFFTHCWKVYTKTNANRMNEKKIVDCDYKLFFDEVKRYLDNHKDCKVICYFHWNYDLEELPFPAHRKLAHDLIDQGVYAVVGNHSHIPQGGELYKGRPIVYGLGNFYLPSNYFFDGNLNYSSMSKKMMILEINENTEEIMCHWFWTDKERTLEFICTERFDDGELIDSYSPYRNMNQIEYIKYFKKNRKKSFFVPVFDNYSGIGTQIKEWLAINRIKLIKHIKGWKL